MSEVKRYGRVGLIGVGLMGSSVALGLKKLGMVDTWVGMDTNPQAIQDALKVGSIQEVTTDFDELAHGVEWLLIAAPVKTTVEIAAKIIPLIRDAHYFIMDVGSTKRHIVETLDMLFQKHQAKSGFMGCHPIAGKEKTGPLVADADLFRDKTVYMTPTPHTDVAVVSQVETLWKQLGAHVRHLDPETHDDILAVSSHLPHMVAFALMDAVQSGYEKKKINHSLAGGLRDMTRVVSSSSDMWAEICADNADNILKQMEVFRRCLHDLYDLVKAKDVALLKSFFAEKKLFRDVLQ